MSIRRSIAGALEGDPLPEVARIPLVRADGRIARPKGSAITSDGRYAVISAGPNDPYGVALVYR